ncbi:MAG: hypothetical protein ACJ764_07280 [Solirubrobacteraceae bacterium]
MWIKGSVAVCASALALVAATAGTAGARGSAGADPRSNFPIRSLPDACWTSPKGASCLRASVRYLDRARARLGQPPYALPRNFVSMTAPQQVLVLTNLDRMLYRLAPIPGLTAGLNRDAAHGVRYQNDPEPSHAGWGAYTSNWAGGYPNIVMAYEGWMYDDGMGSGNLDCTARNHSGCWGHRHDILWRFGHDGALAMGAAAKTGRRGSGYAMLLEQTRPGIHPSYTYRWAWAVRAGAHARRAPAHS